MSDYLHAAVEAAQAAGGLLRANFGAALKVDENHAHDIKLELDRRSQTLIESLLLARYPDHAIYGEEGMRGDPDSEYQWIIDPIDGTVNFFYGVPHFAVSIALRREKRILVGVIYDPMRDELWACEEGRPATLNGLPIRVSDRTELSESIVAIGLSKTLDSVNASLPLFTRMVREAKKCRMMGSASLDIAYVACGRLDAYVEGLISLWDIAAGLLLVETAGGKVDLRPHATEPDKYSIAATSGNIDLGI
ncbi:MAG: inositol monophosphatase family protein [Terrimicrobiaceae bacterium]|nr:inositol monophosphatase family protein [Terrimicrobiaceae bacterium]